VSPIADRFGQLCCTGEGVCGRLGGMAVGRHQCLPPQDLQFKFALPPPPIDPHGADEPDEICFP